MKRQSCGICQNGMSGVVEQKLDCGRVRSDWTVKNYNNLPYSFVAIALVICMHYIFN